MVGISSALISILFGTTIGMVAGYAGGRTDMLLMRLADMIMVMPTLLVVLILSALFGQLNIWVIVLMIALFRWPGVARVIRSQTLSLRHRPFIEAAWVAGASHVRIIFRHILPNVMPLALLYMTFRVTSAIIIEAALAFLGFGDPGTVSWGMMLQWVWKTGHMFQAPYWLLPPGICISLITMAFYMTGRAMDDVLDPRLRKEESKRDHPPAGSGQPEHRLPDRPWHPTGGGRRLFSCRPGWDPWGWWVNPDAEKPLSAWALWGCWRPMQQSFRVRSALKART
jgi:peptide/nickel transport system permease protein